MTTEATPRPLDHLVLPVSGLDTARHRLAELGFTVAPNGVHPFGTANCCVFFADGTFLEPLAVADEAMTQATAGTGNVFTRHALDFADRNGPDGFSAVVFGTGNAERDHASFVEAGISAGDILNFGRDFVTADGTRDRAEFRLAFALDSAAPDCLFFTCERVTVPKVDRSVLLRHENGASGITGATMTAADPDSLVGFLTAVSGAGAETTSRGVQLRSGAFTLDVVTPQSFAEETGLPVPEGRLPHFAAITSICRDTQQLSERFLLAGIDFNWMPGALVVPPAPGQGTAFIFLSPVGD